MSRTGYHLSVLAMPARTPGWARDITADTRAEMDAQYLHGRGLDNFYDQAEGWIQT